MAVNLAEKYSSQVDEKFKQTSITSALINRDYDWVGVKTIKIYSIDTVTPGDYTRSGANRYGTPEELGDSVKEYTVEQDKAFIYSYVPLKQPEPRSISPYQDLTLLRGFPYMRFAHIFEV